MLVAFVSTKYWYSGRLKQKMIVRLKFKKYKNGYHLTLNSSEHLSGRR